MVVRNAVIALKEIDVANADIVALTLRIAQRLIVYPIEELARRKNIALVALIAGNHKGNTIAMKARWIALNIALHKLYCIVEPKLHSTAYLLILNPFHLLFILHRVKLIDEPIESYTSLSPTAALKQTLRLRHL